MAGSHSSKKVVLAALAGNSAIAVTKFIAAAVTGSSAMFSEGVHSLVDTGNQALLLLGMSRAQKPADTRYPFGHGKEVYFWGFVVAILLFAGGAGVSVVEGVYRMRHPHPVENPAVNFIVLGLALVFETGAWWVAYRALQQTRGRKSLWRAVQSSKDPGLFVVLFEDTAAMAGLLVALAGVTLSAVTGNPIYDGASAVVIGIVLGLTAVFLAMETKSLLLGESADPDTVQGIRDILDRSPGVESAGEVLTMHMGPRQVLVNIGVHFRKDMTSGQVASAVAEIETSIRGRFPAIKRIYIEANPAAGRPKENHERERQPPGRH